MTNPHHVILLKKNLKPINKLEDSWIPSPSSHWMALGHFDDIYLYSIESHNFFTSISEDKTSISVHNNGSAFFHPLYLVPTEPETNTNNDYIFIAIVRIHLAEPTGLKDQFQNLQPKIKSAFASPDFSCHVYYATEFSDMVLEVCSNNFESLLKKVLSLRKNDEIGKTYTYFGINMDFLSSEKPFPESNDTIPYLSMRFSGQNLPVIYSQINLIRQKLGRKAEYCITGIDDILVYYTQLPTKDLITLYRELLFNKTYVNIRKSESTTRIGIEDIEHSFNFNPTAPTDYDPHPLCANLLNLKDDIYNWIVSTNSQTHFGWFHAISETANSLVRMSRSPVMDELVYLLAPGVDAFLSNVKCEITNPNSSLSLSSKTCYEYVESCTYFMEQLIRIEGQLSHNPEIRPVIYDIPVFMLEYTLAFLNKISLLLQHPDSSSLQKLRYVFLLVPRPCDHITAKELFPAQNGQDGLVKITIPEKILYNASEILRALCHEISHYVGENTRNREKRKSYYSRAAAALANRYIFQSNKHAAIYALESLIMSELNQQTDPTIHQMHSIVADKIDDIVLDEQEFFNFKTQCYKITTSYPLPSLPQDNLLYYLDIFHERLKDLDILFREVYADICMLYILSISPKDYVESLISELIAHPPKNSTYKDAFAIRIYVALKSTGNDTLNVIDKDNSYYNLWLSLYERIKKISDAIENGTTGQFKLSLPISSVFALLEYASACYSSITHSLKNYSNQIKEIQKMFTEFSDENFDYISFLEKIDEYRLTRWSQTNT